MEGRVVLGVDLDPCEVVLSARVGEENAKTESCLRVDRRVLNRMGESNRDRDPMRCLRDLASERVDPPT
jgi:hypothetical protein